MTVYCTTIAPFRIAEGEGSIERCTADQAEGWTAFRDGGRNYVYRTKREACRASEILEVGGFPSDGRPWWPRGTIYIGGK